MALLTRARFLRGAQGRPDARLRPPWALDEPLFQRLCDRCESCLDACPEKIIVMADDGYPVVKFDTACTFCGDCLSACATGALMPADSPWRLSPEIDSRCFSKNAMACYRCVESCEQEAIVLQARTGGRFQIRTDASLCDGCGACVPACPVGALQLGKI